MNDLTFSMKRVPATTYVFSNGGSGYSTNPLTKETKSIRNHLRKSTRITGQNRKASENPERYVELTTFLALSLREELLSLRIFVNPGKTKVGFW